jgi:hypothetical protein
MTRILASTAALVAFVVLVHGSYSPAQPVMAGDAVYIPYGTHHNYIQPSSLQIYQTVPFRLYHSRPAPSTGSYGPPQSNRVATPGYQGNNPAHGPSPGPASYGPAPSVGPNYGPSQPSGSYSPVQPQNSYQASALYPSQARPSSGYAAPTYAAAPQYQQGSGNSYQTGAAPSYQSGSGPSYQTGSAPSYQGGSAPSYQSGSAPSYQSESASPYQSESGPSYQSGPSQSYPSGPAASLYQGGSSYGSSARPYGRKSSRKGYYDSNATFYDGSVAEAILRGFSHSLNDNNNKAVVKLFQDVSDPSAS